MSIASVLEKKYLINEQQSKIISHQHGPLLIIAGPGSGKTRSLTLLAMNLLLQGQAQPSELLLCTYTEKATCEMRDRLMGIARDVGYQQDLASLRIGTIHGICQQLIAENIHFTRIDNDFVTLDQFTQQLLIFEEINTICPPKMKRLFQHHWGTSCQDASDWEIAKELGSCFDKITEELLFDKLKERYAQTTPSILRTDNDRLRYCLTYAYSTYQKILEAKNCLDFAHLQKCVYNLLCDPATFPYLTRGIRYVLVDEYQDTNYIQEQILTRLASATDDNNLFVVGDEDQALYRFRGATVRNILEFEQNFPNCKPIRLMTNYRSHQSIIDTYNAWISSINWSNSQGIPFRTEKSVCSNHDNHVDYPAVCTMTSHDIYEEAEQFAELVASLKQEGKIQDYSQVALLLHSVKPRFSTDYIQALEKRNIPYICPRAEFYFEQEEVSLMIGCFARILDFADEHYEIAGTDFPNYLKNCREQLHKASLLHLPLRTMLFRMREEIIQSANQPEAQGKPLEDYFYRLITVSPFLRSIKDVRPNQEAQPQNLKIFSRLLQMFQRYYRYTGITQHHCQDVARDFFQKFLHLLYSNGFNQDEGSQQSFPQGHVPILTIHQAKGLEFPVVVVGGLNKLFSSSDSQKQQVWQEFAHLPPYEPLDQIASFDLRRLYYVAFSRAEKLLVLAAVKKPDAALASLWQNLPAWSPAQISMLPNSKNPKPPFTPQPRYGFTSHIQLYETCPRQFQFFRHYNFTPGHNEKYFSGQLVHHTLEHIHRVARDGGLTNLSEQTVHTIFQHKYQALRQSYLTPVDESQKAKAWRQVLHYFQQNQEELHNIADAELQVQIDNSSHVLTGKIDLLVKTTGGTDLIDFKTLPRQRDDSVLVEQYGRQLHFYAHALESHHRPRPQRLFLYWTAEERKERALMEIPYQAEKMEKISLDLDRIVSNIEKKNFHVQKPPAFETCQCCHIRHLCQQDGVI